MFLTRPCFWWQTRGAEIHLRVKELLDVLLARLKDIECGQTRRSVLAARLRCEVSASSPRLGGWAVVAALAAGGPLEM